MAKYHSNSAYPPKFLVEFEAKYLPQIAPEAVSEHEYVKISWGACPQTPLEVLGFSSNSGFAIVQPPQIKMSRSALVWEKLIVMNLQYHCPCRMDMRRLGANHT